MITYQIHSLTRNNESLNSFIEEKHLEAEIQANECESLKRKPLNESCSSMSLLKVDIDPIEIEVKYDRT